MDKLELFSNLLEQDVAATNEILNDNPILLISKKYEDCMSYMKAIQKELLKFKKTGGKLKKISREDFIEKEKENDTSVAKNGRGRPARGKAPLSSSSNLMPEDLFNIKKEKLSVDKPAEVAPTEIKIKEEMPPPTQLAPRKKRIKTEKDDPPPQRSTRTKTLRTKSEESIRKDSDVIVQAPTIPVVVISDDDCQERPKRTRTTRNVSNETTAEADKRTRTTRNVANETHSEVDTTTTRSTRTKTRKAKKDATVMEVAAEEEPREEPSRSTRTKTRALKKDKRVRDPSTDAENKDFIPEKKRSKSGSDQEVSEKVRAIHSETIVRETRSSRTESNGQKDVHNTTNQTEYEDAVSTIESNPNATYVSTSPVNKNIKNDPILDATVVVEKPILVKKDSKKDSLLTDDDSDTESKRRCKPAPKSVKESKKKKELFNPFEASPVKKKVEAFEKLGKPDGNSSKIPTKKGDTPLKNAGKYNTPLTNKFIPKICSTSNISRIIGKTSTDSANTTANNSKPLSALKASQAEYRERMRKQQEKEQEALKKREALLQAQTQEKKKKREEKQLKAQQQREIIEKEKLKMLEQQKLKEERHKQMMAEKEEKLKKVQEEQELKRQKAKEAAVKALKEKEALIRADEKKRMEKRKDDGDRKRPIYMVQPMPLLPTEDCLDSDDENYKKVQIRWPSWCSDSALKKQQKVMEAAGQTIKNTFFCMQAQTPDLTLIFQEIDPRKLKRTSSAIWRRPPRYTLMPKYAQPEFEEDFEEDDE